MSGEVAGAGDTVTMSLTHRVWRAGGLIGAGQMAGHALRLISTLILTRLLAPEMFGTMAIVFTVVTIVTMLSDVGLLPSIVRSRREEDQDFLDTAWTVQIVRGFLIWAVAALAALLLHLANHQGLVSGGTTLAEPSLPALILAGAAAAIITGFQSTNLYLAYRRLDMGRVMMVEILGQLAGLVVSVAWAWHFPSPWALAGGALAAALTSAYLTHRVLPGPGNRRLRWERRSLEELVALGRAVLLSSVIGVLASNVDRLLFGALIAPEQLGLYTIALTLSAMALGTITRITNAVSLPALSEVQRIGTAEFRAACFRLRRVSDIALLAAAGMICALGESIIRLLYDTRYEAAGVILAILGLSLVGGRYAIMLQVYLALGRASYLVRVNAVILLAVLILVPLAYASHGFLAAVAVVALKDLIAVPLIFFLNGRHGLNDFGYEIRVLAVLPLAYGAGRLLDALLAPALS
ncbi:MAG: oligosaccharide flippase family protein [Sulfuritalea sp.]|nr:oligosaccharide flippase family protein [Sulfuritalea sp.]